MPKHAREAALVGNQSENRLAITNVQWFSVSCLPEESRFKTLTG